MKQKCAKCQKEKELEEFYLYKSGPNGRQRHCIDCKKQFDREHFQRHPERRLARNRVAIQKDQQLIAVAKSTGCAKCNELRSYVLDLHHIDPSDKENDVSSLKGRSVKLIKELEKCIVLCANCHREFHHFQRMDENLTVERFCLMV